jgi:Family of unknown function (DUF6403)
VSTSWPIWLIGCIVLIVAGFLTAFGPRWRARAYTQEAAWSTARAAIDSASISRDASETRVIEAEQLLARAETIAADRGGRAAALTATGYAERADTLWRAAASD